MTRTIHTLWTAGGTDMCNANKVCPGVHDLSDRPDVHFVITREAAPAEIAAWPGMLDPGQVLGAVPRQMHPSGWMVTTRVTDPAALAAFAHLMGPGEVLGTVPAGTWTLQEAPAC